MWRGGNKYHAKKVEFDGIKFDSKKEGLRYLKLKSLEEEGKISNLRRQVKYELLPAIYQEKTIKLKTKEKIKRTCIQRAVNYMADFVYEFDGKTIVEDCKGLKTKEYLLKKKMMLSILGIEILET